MTDTRITISRETSWPLIFVVALAAILRSLYLGSESFWIDELITLSRIQKTPLQILIDWDSATQGSLYYLLQQIWFAVMGGTETTLRISAVLYGTMAVFALYHLGRKLFDEKTGLYAALFLAVNPFAIYYSQEARPYTLFLLLSIGSYYYALKLFGQFSRRDAFLYVSFLAAAMYTHPFGIFLFPSHLLLPWIFKGDLRYKIDGALLKKLLYCWGIVCVLYIPQCLRFAFSFMVKVAGGSTASWITVPSWAALYKAPLDYFMWPSLAITVFWILIAATVWLLYRGSNRRAVIFSLWIYFCFWIVPWMESQFLTPIYVVRYTIPALSVVMLLMGFAIVKLPKWIRIAVVTLFVLATAVPLKAYYTKVDKDPWRQAAESLLPRLEEEDIIIAIPWWTGGHVRHYLSPYGINPVLRIPKSDRLAEAVSGHQRVWLVESYEPKPDWTDALHDAMKGYVPGTTVNILDSLTLNPYNYWVAPIRYTLYTLNQPESGTP